MRCRVCCKDCFAPDVEQAECVVFAQCVDVVNFVIVFGCDFVVFEQCGGHSVEDPRYTEEQCFPRQNVVAINPDDVEC